MIAKNFILIKNSDSISFSLNRKKDTATITYYYNWNDHMEVINCNIERANQLWESAMEDGFEIAF